MGLFQNGAFFAKVVMRLPVIGVVNACLVFLLGSAEIIKSAHFAVVY